MKVGLRVDVDTFRGTRKGVPELMRIMDRHGVHAAFFFSAGPDNMGRHLWRLLKPAFLWKMLRTKAASLYGLDILLMGTMWPGPGIAKHNKQVFRDCASAGHEIGLHAWDHHFWQAHVDNAARSVVERHLQRAYETITEAAGQEPVCSAAPGWKCSETALEIKEQFRFRYNSDCRGSGMFRPQVADGTILSTPQIALDLPTYDELLGRDGVTNENYNERLLSLITPGEPCHLLTIHAEAEGGLCAPMFDKFLSMAKERDIQFVPPGELIPDDLSSLPVRRIAQKEIPGREGTLAVVA